MAERADRHVCYERSVQCAEAELDFIDAEFKRLRKRLPTTIREDFCGTAAVCCEWVRRRKTNRAIGVDLDRATLDWSIRRHVARLRADQRARLTLLNADVLRVRTKPVDAVLAMNFSYYTFKTRDVLRRYFRRAHAALVRDGVFFLDCWGGYDAFRVLREPTRVGRTMTYIWDQAAYNPITGDITCHIHFRFADGSRLRRAFTYDWRLWTIPELRELLAEAGFRRTTVYWEGEDRHGESNGEFTPAETGEADPGWVCYITAEK